MVNIGGGQPVGLNALQYETIERALGVAANKGQCCRCQKGDFVATFAKAELLEALTGYRPSTPVEEGVRRFVEWYRGYHGQ